MLVVCLPSSQSPVPVPVVTKVTYNVSSLFTFASESHPGPVVTKDVWGKWRSHTGRVLESKLNFP